MKTQNTKPNQRELPIDALTKELLLDLRDELNVLHELFSIREEVGFSTRYLLHVRIGALPRSINEKIFNATDEALFASLDEQIVNTVERTKKLIKNLSNRMTGGKTE